MKLKQTLLLSTLGLASISATAGSFNAFDARSAAMGGTGVASAQISSAPFYNPAMLAAQNAEEDFSLLVGAGISAQDNDDLLSHLSSFVDAIGASNLTLANTEAAAAGAANPASIQVNTVAVGGWASKTWSMAASSTGSIRADIDFTYSGSGDSGAGSTLTLAGLQTKETNISAATSFDKFSFGITPKSVSVSTYATSVTASSNGDINTIVDSLTATGTNHGSNFNLDAGVVYHISDNLKVGATMQNLMAKSYTSGSTTFKINTTTRVGVGYTGDMVTLAADYDLTKSDPVVSGGDATQFLALGAEIDLLDSIQLRAGYNSNTAVSSSKPTLTAGLGFNLLGLQLDLTAMQNGKATSAFLQLGVRW